MKTLFLMLMIFTVNLHADEIKLHLVSYHTTNREWLANHDALNEINPGLAYSKDKYEAGIYMNSESVSSVYILRHIPMNNISFDVGLVSGYRSSPILPIVGITTRYKHTQFGLLASATVKGDLVPVITFSLVLDRN